MVSGLQHSTILPPSDGISSGVVTTQSSIELDISAAQPVTSLPLLVSSTSIAPASAASASAMPKSQSFICSKSFNEVDCIQSGLYYDGLTIEEELHDTPPGELDTRSLAEGKIRFLRTQACENWKKRVVVVSYLALDETVHSLELFQTECFFESILNSGFSLWFYTESGMVSIKNKSDISKCLNTLALVDEKTLVKASAEVKIGKEQLFWVNWDSFRPLFNKLANENLKCVGDALPIFGIDKDGLSCDAALTLIRKHNFAHVVSEKQSVKVSTHLTRKNFNSVSYLLKMAPGASRVHIQVEDLDLLKELFRGLNGSILNVLQLSIRYKEGVYQEKWQIARLCELEIENNWPVCDSLCETPSNSNNQFIEGDFLEGAKYCNLVRQGNTYISHPNRICPVLTADHDVTIDCHSVYFFIAADDSSAYNGKYTLTDRVKEIDFTCELQNLGFKIEGARSCESLSIAPGSGSQPFLQDNWDAISSLLLENIKTVSGTIKVLDIKMPLEFETGVTDGDYDIFYLKLVNALSSMTFDRLEKLHLSGVPIGFSDFTRFLSNCPKLQVITLKKVFDVDDDKMSHCLPWLPTTYLHINSPDLTSDFVARLCQLMPELQILLAPSFELNSKSALFLPELQLLGCQIDKESQLRSLQQQFPKVGHFFQHSHRLDVESIDTPFRVYDCFSSSASNLPQVFDEFVFDAGGEKGRFRVAKIFQDVDPTEHREQVSTVTYSNGELHVTECKANPELYIPPKDVVGEIESAKQEFFLDSNWTAITTLSPTDILCNIQSTFVSQSDLEFGYDGNLRLYFVRLRSGACSKKVSLSYSVARRSPIIDISASCWDPNRVIAAIFDERGCYVIPETFGQTPIERITTLVAFFNSFSVGGIDFDEDTPLWVKLNAILACRCNAACLGRSQLFCVLAPIIVPGIQARIISNTPHAFVEVIIDGAYLCYDLGGYPLDIEIVKEEVYPEERVVVPLPKTTILPKEKMCMPLCEGTQTLLLVKSEQIPLVYRELQRQAQRENLPFGYLDSKKRQLYYTKRVQVGFERRENACMRALQSGGMIVLDLSQLDPSSIGAVCQLTDLENRMISNVAVVPETKIVALLPDTVQVSQDIGRRFPVIKQVPEDFALESRFSPLVIEEASSLPKNALRINLYENRGYWWSRLIETLDEKMNFVPGKLVEAVLQNRPIVIYNRPHDRQFELFLASLESGFVTFSGEKIAIGHGFKVYLARKKPKKVSITVEHTMKPVDYVLNSATFFNFFNFVKADGKAIVQLPGILAQSANRTISVLVAETLTEWQWQEFFDVMRALKVDCKFIADQELLCDGLVSDFIAVKSVHSPSIRPYCNRFLISSTDISYTVANLMQAHPEALTVYIHERVTGNDLFPRLCSGNEGCFDFHVEEGQLFEALKSGRSVILYGQFSKRLLGELASLFATKKPGIYVNGEFVPLAGSLYCVVVEGGCKGLPATRECPTKNDRVAFLEKKYSKTEIKIAYVLLEKAGLAPTYGAVERLIAYRKQQIDAPLSCFKTDPGLYSAVENRVERILDVWKVSPIVYLYGPPASGKTHLLVYTLPEALSGHHFYYSKSKIEAFLTDTGPAVLCLDEGDLHPEVIDSLMTLQLATKELYYNRKIYPIVGSKRVIITGNSHFASRKKLPFISQFAGAIYVPRLDVGYIKTAILLPLLPEDAFYGHFLAHCMKIYSAEVRQNPDIDIRHLRSMCALAQVYHTYMPDCSALEVATSVFLDLFPDLSLTEINLDKIEECKRAILVEKCMPNGAINGCIITKSRERLVWKLFALMEARKNHYSGLQPGLLVEGAAGEGKSQIVRHFLNNYLDEGVAFISLQDDPVDVQKRLFDAFYNGTVVAIDEFDGLYEEVLNQYLTGRDLDGKKPKRPGFFLIGTANSSDYSYRLPRSCALDSRMIIEKVKTYPDNELVDILVKKGIEQQKAEERVKRYRLDQQATSLEVLKPTPATLLAAQK